MVKKVLGLCLLLAVSLNAHFADIQDTQLRVLDFNAIAQRIKAKEQVIADNTFRRVLIVAGGAAFIGASIFAYRYVTAEKPQQPAAPTSEGDQPEFNFAAKQIELKLEKRKLSYFFKKEAGKLILVPAFVFLGGISNTLFQSIQKVLSNVWHGNQTTHLSANLFGIALKGYNNFVQRSHPNGVWGSDFIARYNYLLGAFEAFLVDAAAGVIGLSSDRTHVRKQVLEMVIRCTEIVNERRMFLEQAHDELTASAVRAEFVLDEALDIVNDLFEWYERLKHE